MNNVINLIKQINGASDATEMQNFASKLCTILSHSNSAAVTISVQHNGSDQSPQSVVISSVHLPLSIMWWCANCDATSRRRCVPAPPPLKDFSLNSYWKWP
ncbi:hypothetical protein niasHT_025397 [Heterodera trifolii]|uniref:Uncharacterized protein n=1 Tax=Heterodera trifolii TaxID=157864 RepID=A0ABD2KEP8_9BILA